MLQGEGLERRVEQSEEVQQEAEEEGELQEMVVSQQSPPTHQKQDTKVSDTCLTCPTCLTAVTLNCVLVFQTELTVDGDLTLSEVQLPTLLPRKRRTINTLFDAVVCEAEIKVSALHLSSDSLTHLSLHPSVSLSV